MTNLSIALPAEFVDAVAEGVATKLAGQLRQAEGGEPWRLWDAAEVAERLGRSERWVRTQTQKGRLPYVRLDDGARRYDPDRIRDFVRANSVGLDEADLSTAKPRGLRAVGRDWLDE